jgi:exopolyphosphatase/guanosine-5'-triphosphate,3'-diphosphate pyrophosphatase
MTGAPLTLPAMRVAIVDVGSNTARLLVADIDGSVEAVHEEKTFLGLAADLVRHGTLSGDAVSSAARTARRYVRTARKHGADELDVIVTAPGRHGEPDALLDALRRSTGELVRVLTAEEEGRLAFQGALAREPRDLPGLVAVCDVGGGSTEIAVGTQLGGPAWIRSADIGSLRLTRSCLQSDPPTVEEMSGARATARDALAQLIPPRPAVALAVGGSARAAAKVVGEMLGPDDLALVAALCERRPTAKLAKTFGIDRPRAETLLAGALVLAEASRVLGVPFRLARGGLREGAALALAERVEASEAA